MAVCAVAHRPTGGEGAAPYSGGRANGGGLVVGPLGLQKNGGVEGRKEGRKGEGGGNGDKEGIGDRKGEGGRGERDEGRKGRGKREEGRGILACFSFFPRSPYPMGTKTLILPHHKDRN